MRGTEEGQTQVESTLLHAGEQLGNEAYEQYTAGAITLDELEEVYERLSLWRHLSGVILATLYHDARSTASRASADQPTNDNL